MMGAAALRHHELFTLRDLHQLAVISCRDVNQMVLVLMICCLRGRFFEILSDPRLVDVHELCLVLVVE